jgi:hypothetical protein
MKNLGKSQPVLIMLNPVISPRTRMHACMHAGREYPTSVHLMGLAPPPLRSCYPP